MDRCAVEVALKFQNSGCGFQGLVRCRTCLWVPRGCGFLSNVCGFQNSVCGFQNSTCGLYNSVCGLQNNASGLQNRACGLSNGASVILNRRFVGFRAAPVSSRTELGGPSTKPICFRTTPMSSRTAIVGFKAAHVGFSTSIGIQQFVLVPQHIMLCSIDGFLNKFHVDSKGTPNRCQAIH